MDVHHSRHSGNPSDSPPAGVNLTTDVPGLTLEIVPTDWLYILWDGIVVATIDMDRWVNPPWENILKERCCWYPGHGVCGECAENAPYNTAEMNT